MITASIQINRNVDTVWKYFTTPSHWQQWYGGELRAVEPDWMAGGYIIWGSGDRSLISNLIPKREISIVGSWMDTTYSFQSVGKAKTIVSIVLSDPKGGAIFSDGGAAHKANRESALRKFKDSIESETNEEPLDNETSSKRWWEFWK
jgi:hypothetical protein